MTIAAGFQCSDGVLISADTEVSAYGLSFRDSKIFRVETDQLKALFSYTGPVDLAHAVIQKCLHKLESAKQGSIKSHHDLSLLVEQVVNAEYRKHVSANPDPHAESIYQLLIAAWCTKSEGGALYSTWQGTIKRVRHYACLGAGLYVGHYLLGPVFNRAMELDKARVLALYTVSAAKEHVDGVGGKTELMSLGHDGSIVPNEWHSIEPFEKALKFYDANVRHLLFALLSTEDRQFDGQVDFFVKLLRNIRRNLKIDDKSQAEQIAANERLISYLDSLAKRSAQQSTTPDPSDQQPSQE